MAKKKQTKKLTWEQQHLRNVARYERQIDDIYREAAREAASIGATIKAVKGDTLFSFADYPLTRKRVDSLLSGLTESVEAVILNGVRASWTLANNKNNELSQRVFGDNVGKLTQAQYRRYFSDNDEARQAFEQRKVNGMNLSNRVWRYTDQFKEEIEMGLDVGIRNGLSADQMARELNQYLQHPDMLFRRVRDEHGMLQLSQRAAAYHPGQGVYRSSYKNCRRLAATETNIAYHTADYLRWQDLDFVVGIEIHLSSNHTLLGQDGLPHDFTDICDELAGRYPKDFKFTGWHPHCRCYATSILKTPEELEEDTRKILNGEELDGESVNRVDDVPDEFKSWVQDNAARIVKANSLPYFMTDNTAYVTAAFTEKQASTVIHKPMLKEIMSYFGEYYDRDPRLAAIWNIMDDRALYDNLSDIEYSMMFNQIKTISGNIAFADLQSWGLIDDTMTMSGLRRSMEINGKTFDMIAVKDAAGKEFLYPLGLTKSDKPFSAVTASGVVSEMPRFLRDGIKSVGFMTKYQNPQDSYWAVAYNKPGLVSIASDGGRIHFWSPLKADDLKEFKQTIYHEATHVIDKGDKISLSAEWRAAVMADIELAKQGRGKVVEYVTEYSKKHPREDLCDSMSMFMNNRARMKEIAPNRERFLSDLSKELSKRFRKF